VSRLDRGEGGEECVMFLDWLILGLGLAGFIGTIFEWKPFYNEENMKRTVSRIGRTRLKVLVAGVYLAFGLLGLFWLLTA
jgi:hypothetical protein